MADSCLSSGGPGLQGVPAQLGREASGSLPMATALKQMLGKCRVQAPYG